MHDTSFASIMSEQYDSTEDKQVPNMPSFRLIEKALSLLAIQRPQQHLLRLMKHFHFREAPEVSDISGTKDYTSTMEPEMNL